MSARGARIQPRRRPPQNDLLALPIVIASWAWAANGRGIVGQPVERQRLVGLVDDGDACGRGASARRSSSRWLSLIRWPVGFWKSGIR